RPAHSWLGDLMTPDVPISVKRTSESLQAGTGAGPLTAHPVSGCRELDQIVYAPPDDPLLVPRRRLPPLGIVQQQPRGDFPLLRSRRPQVPIEILGGDLRQSLCPVREFPGDTEIVKGWKPVPPRNRFWTTTR